MNGEKKAGRRGAGGGGAGGDGSAKANAVEREGARVDWKVNLTWLSPAVQASACHWPVACRAQAGAFMQSAALSEFLVRADSPHPDS